MSQQSPKRELDEPQDVRRTLNQRVRELQQQCADLGEVIHWFNVRKGSRPEPETTKVFPTP
jgi:hypothetical protein